MAEIEFEDILSHYYQKIKEAVDDLESVKQLNQNVLTLSGEKWQGDAANAFQDKVMEMNTRIEEARLELSETMKSLAEISNTI